MCKIFPIILILLAGTSLSAQTPTPPDADQGRILALENSWNQAVQQKDTSAMSLLLGSELVYVDYDGKLMDKLQYIASVQSQQLHPVHIASESMTVHLYGTTAVVNGVYRENGMKNGKPYMLRERFTDTWISRGRGWVCVASHSTLINQ